MHMKLAGTPSDELPDVLAAGATDIRTIFLSMSAREPTGRDADYLEWHSLDHRPEQHRIAGLRQSIRLVSTPACRAARLVSSEQFDAVDHVMTYFFAEAAAFDKFRTLSAALNGLRRPFRLPSVFAAYFQLAGKIASPTAIAGADVLPWRPARGVFILIEREAQAPTALASVDGIAGIWWHRGGASPEAGHSDNTGIQVSYCFLDADPIEIAARLREPLAQRWARGEGTPLLAAPFYVLVPFEWRRYLP
jgi:hypothetical protein